MADHGGIAQGPAVHAWARTREAERRALPARLGGRGLYGARAPPAQGAADDRGAAQAEFHAAASSTAASAAAASAAAASAAAASSTAASTAGAFCGSDDPRTDP